MFFQGCAISGFLGSNCGSPNCNSACFSRRFSSTEANALMDFHHFIGIACFYRRFALGDTNLCVAWEHFPTAFLHNRSFLIDDFATPRSGQKWFMFLQGWEIPGCFGSSWWHGKLRYRLFSKRFAAAEAKTLMCFLIFTEFLCFNRRCRESYCARQDDVDRN